MVKKNRDTIETEVKDQNLRKQQELSDDQNRMTKIEETEQSITENFINIKGLEGKKIVDDAGEVIGKVQSVYIDPETLNIKGISIDNGLFKGSDFIDSSYIGNISEEGVVLFNAPIDRTNTKDYVGEKIPHDESMGTQG